MKKIIMSFIMVGCISFSTMVLAAPFVVTEHFNKNVVDSCVAKIDNATETIEVSPTVLSANPDMALCKFDVGNVADGQHTITIYTKNIWGVSSPVPFDFTKTLPPVLKGLHLSIK